VIAAAENCVTLEFMHLKVSAVLALLTFGCFAYSQEIHCKDAIVKYEPPTPAISRNIKLDVIDDVGFAGTAKEASPQGTRWFIASKPDYMQPGPWSTTLIIGDRAGDTAFLKASFQKHGNVFAACWLNEKLIFIQVWWGRTASSDLILAVERKSFIYNEVADYAQVTFCKEK